MDNYEKTINFYLIVFFYVFVHLYFKLMVSGCVLCSGAARACFEGEISRALLHVNGLRGNPAPLPGPQPHQALLAGGEDRFIAHLVK